MNWSSDREASQAMEGIKKMDFKNVKKILLGFLLMLLLVIGQSDYVFARVLSANQILNKVEQTTSPPHESAEFKMLVKAAGGESKQRHILIKRSNRAKSQNSLVRILEPRDLKGLALLSSNKDDFEKQWLYLPSSKRSRRIVGSGRKGRFLDSDLSYEDLSLSTYKNFKHKVIKRSGKGKSSLVIIESVAKKNSESSYGKIKTWVSLKYFRVIKAEYFDKSNILVKRMKFNNYSRYGRRFWRAKQVVVNHLVKKSQTTLKLLKLSLRPLREAEFSLAALEDE